MATIYLPKTRTWGEALAGGLGSGFSSGVSQGLEEKRRAKAEEPARKQEAITSAYKIAQEALTGYMENPDPDDKTPFITAKALAAEQFDNYMSSVGFSDVTYLTVSGTDTQKEEDTEEKPPIVPPSILPQGAPQVAKTGEQIGRAAQPILKGARQVTGGLSGPTSAPEILGRGYNMAAGVGTGMTGIPAKTIPPNYMQYMQQGGPLGYKGALPQTGQALGQGVGVAGDYYKQLIQNIMAKFLSGRPGDAVTGGID